MTINNVPGKKIRKNVIRNQLYETCVTLYAHAYNNMVHINGLTIRIPAIV